MDPELEKLKAELAEKDKEITQLKKDKDFINDLCAKKHDRMIFQDAVIAELREALYPFGKLNIPKRHVGNAGYYSIIFDDISRVKKALANATAKTAVDKVRRLVEALKSAFHRESCCDRGLGLCQKCIEGIKLMEEALKPFEVRA